MCRPLTPLCALIADTRCLPTCNLGCGSHRCLHLCVQVINRDSGKYTFSVSCCMLELYQDSLMDLLLPPQPKSNKPGPVSAAGPSQQADQH